MTLDSLEAKIGYKFQLIGLLETALSHRSFLNESKQTQSNERLEFLGDAVLSLIVSDYLFETKPQEPEGFLTAARSVMVRTETLAKVANLISLGDYLRMSHGEEKTGGRTNSSLLENAAEALIGAIFKDGGLVAAKDFVYKHVLPIAEQVLATGVKDPKSMLQETVQDMGYPAPTYFIVETSGPDHDKLFVVGVNTLGKSAVATGSGKTKQAAEQEAAQKVLNQLKTGA